MRRRKDTSISGSRDANVWVVARIRPALPDEEHEPQGIDTQPGSNSVVARPISGKQRHFTVDEVFDSRLPSGSQEKVFEGVGRSLVASALEGYNVCVMAYGHTGSGKTYTMIGSGSSAPVFQSKGAGLLPRFLWELGSQVDDGEPRYRVEFVEVYNEKIRDLLLSGSDHDRVRKVHVHPKFGVIVDGLKPAAVSSVDEALGLLHFGNQMRTVSATTMNSRSSRSHAIFTFIFEQPGGNAVAASGESRGVNTVTFVDLAGREDQSVSLNRAVQFKEMVAINTSLFHLSNVIAKLATGALQGGHVLSEFRNSKLTLMLSQALAGNSRTTLVATTAPLASFFEDTSLTLSFAQTAKRIKTAPVVNKSTNDMISDLKEEIARLRAELLSATEVAEGSSGGARIIQLREEAEDAEALFGQLSKLDSSWEDMRTESMRADLRRAEAAHKFGFADVGSTAKSDLPYLVNMDSDPALRGICKYYLDKDQPLVVGDDEEECNMVIQGVGVADQMCMIECLPNGGVVISLIDAGVEEPPRVLVNGKPLVPGLRRELKNGDALIFGFGKGFVLIIPTEGGQDIDLDILSAIECVTDTEGEQFQAALPYLRYLSAHAPDGCVEPLVKALHCVCPLIDEANVITREVLEVGGSVRFELQTLTDLFDFESDTPDLAVCIIKDSVCSSDQRRTRGGSRLIQSGRLSTQPTTRRNSVFSNLVSQNRASCSGGAGSAAGRGSVFAPLAQDLGIEEHMRVGKDNNKLKYVWSLEKFLGRLAAFREVYEEGMAAGDGFAAIRLRFQAKPHLDPWRECALDEISVLDAAALPGKCEAPLATPLLSGEFLRRPQFRDPERGPTLNRDQVSTLPEHASMDRTVSLSSASGTKSTSLLCQQVEQLTASIDELVAIARSSSDAQPSIAAAAAAAAAAATAAAMAVTSPAPTRPCDGTMPEPLSPPPVPVYSAAGSTPAAAAAAVKSFWKPLSGSSGSTFPWSSCSALPPRAGMFGEPCPEPSLLTRSSGRPGSCDRARSGSQRAPAQAELDLLASGVGGGYASSRLGYSDAPAVYSASGCSSAGIPSVPSEQLQSQLTSPRLRTVQSAQCRATSPLVARVPTISLLPGALLSVVPSPAFSSLPRSINSPRSSPVPGSSPRRPPSRQVSRQVSRHVSPSPGGSRIFVASPTASPVGSPPPRLRATIGGSVQRTASFAWSAQHTPRSSIPMPRTLQFADVSRSISCVKPGSLAAPPKTFLDPAAIQRANASLRALQGNATQISAPGTPSFSAPTPTSASAPTSLSADVSFSYLVRTPQVEPIAGAC